MGSQIASAPSPQGGIGRPQLPMLINGAENPHFLAAVFNMWRQGDSRVSKKKGTLRAHGAARTWRFCSKSELLHGPDPKDADWDPSLFIDTVYEFKDT